MVLFFSLVEEMTIPPFSFGSIAVILSFTLSKVDRFLQIAKESVDMIKFVANEPSVGLHHVQQHT